MSYGIEVEIGQAVLTEVDEAGFVKAQPDALGETPSAASEPTLTPAGFFARPQDQEGDPDGQGMQGRAGQAILLTSGNERHVVFMSDPRMVAKLAEWGLNGKGASVQYAHLLNGFKSYHYIDGTTGTHTIKVQRAGGGEHTIIIPSDGSDILINGARVTSDGNLITADGISLRTHTHLTAWGPSQPPTPTP